MVTNTFGSILYCPESEQLEEFPSPQSLKGRIMISTKPPKEYRETQSMNDKGSSKKVYDSAEDEPRVSENASQMIELMELIMIGAPNLTPWFPTYCFPAR